MTDEIKNIESIYNHHYKFFTLLIDIAKSYYRLGSRNNYELVGILIEIIDFIDACKEEKQTIRRLINQTDFFKDDGEVLKNLTKKVFAEFDENIASFVPIGCYYETKAAANFFRVCNSPRNIYFLKAKDD